VVTLIGFSVKARSTSVALTVRMLEPSDAIC